MNPVDWWNRNRFWAAPLVAVGSGALVWALIWKWGGHQQEMRPDLGRLASTPTSKRTPPPEIPPQFEPELDAGALRTPPIVAEILRRSPADATAEERALVWAFLRTPPSVLGHGEAVWLLGVDEALTWIRGAVKESEEVESGLLELVQTRGYCDSEREFALQHLGIWAEERLAGRQVLEALQKLVDSERASTLAGQALQALYRSQFAAEEMPWIREAALRLATDPAAHQASRLAALEVGGHCGSREIEPCARQLLAASRTVGERVVALNVLGWVGNRGTMEWMERQAKYGEGLAAAAQKRALQALQAQWGPLREVAR